MFDLDEFFAFNNADVVYCVFAVVLTVAAIFIGRTFFKKI